MDDPALFSIASPAGSAVDAMGKQIEAWQTAGKAVSLVVRMALLQQAHALDLAKAARRPTAITGANKVLLELLVGFRLIGDAPPPAGDPFQAFLAAVADDGNADVPLQTLAREAGAEP